MSVPNQRPFRFGVTAHDARSSEEWRELCVRVEALGFSNMVVPDHFGAQLAPIPALAIAASVTTTLRVGALVASNDFRHPVMYAKELATLDLLSTGRVDWGIGAGWIAPEYAAAGIAFDRPGVRVDRLVEAIAVMKALFGDEPANFIGTHYRVNDLNGYPKPVQRPHPRLLIGGAQQRLLTLAGREADIVGIAPTPKGPNEVLTRQRIEADLARQLAWVRSGAGDRFGDLELSVVAFPVIVDDDRDLREARIGERLGMEPEAVRASPHMWVGSVDHICDSLEQHRDRWNVSSWTIPVASINAAARVVERLTGR